MITLVNGHVQNQGGIAVPNGSISLQLNIDATVNAAPGGLVFAEQELIFQFDASGNLVQPCLIWSNKELNPQNSFGLATYYLVTIYDADGARINKAPMWWQFTEANGATVDISTMTAIVTVGGNVIFYPIPTATTPGGSLNSIQYYGSGGFFAGDTNFTWNPGTQILSVIGTEDLTGPLTIQNVAVSTALANQNSPLFSITGTVWNGAVSITDAWTVQDILSGGTNGDSTLTFLHSGSSGTASVNIGGNLTVTGTITATSITPAGSDTQIQFNNAGVLGADASFTWLNTDQKSLKLTTTTVATALANEPAPEIVLTGNFWNGAASQTATWSFVNSLGAGTNPADTLTLGYAGSSGGGDLVLNASITTVNNSFIFSAGAGSFLTIGNPLYDTASFVLTAAANASGSKTSYTGNFTNTNRPVVNQYTTIAGFSTGANNGHFIVFSCNTTTLVVYNPSGVLETHAGTAVTDSANLSGVFKALGQGLGSYSIAGVTNNILSNLVSTPTAVNLVLGMDGNSVDSGYLRILNDGATGKHGLEIGAIIDGTGAAPVFIQLGKFNGVSEVNLTNQLTQVSSLAAGVVTVTANYVTLLTDYTVITNSAGAVAITLTTTGIPTGQIYVVKNINVGTTTVAGQTGNIDGSASSVLSTQYAHQVYQWDGANFFVMG